MNWKWSTAFPWFIAKTGAGTAHGFGTRGQRCIVLGKLRSIIAPVKKA